MATTKSEPMEAALVSECLPYLVDSLLRPLFQESDVKEVSYRKRVADMSLTMAGGGGGGVGQGSSTCVSKGHRRQESMYAMTGLYGEGEAAEAAAAMAHSSSCGEIGRPGHSRNPSDRSEKASLAASMPPLQPPGLSAPSVALMVVVVKDDNLPGDCGILRCRPPFLQRFAGIKNAGSYALSKERSSIEESIDLALVLYSYFIYQVFVLLLSFLVTLQQALSSGYINSVITTIEKRFEIPSSLSGLVASSYEIGNVITVIFVSYLGSRRHIPVWIAVGSVIMGIGSMVFMVPHFVAEPHSGDDPARGANFTSENICRIVASIREQDMGLGRLGSGLSSPPLAPPNNLHSRGDNCIQGSPSTACPVFLFLVAQLLLGCGGSPLFTLGTTYIDDHVRPESASLYIGCMYSMAAFGPVCGFLLGAYLLSFHMDSFSSEPVTIDPGDRRWVGMWWGGFLLCGLLLVLVSVPFFAFPKTLHREKERIRLMEKARRPHLPNHPLSSVAQPQNPHKIPVTHASSPPSLAASPPPLSPNPPPPPPPPLSSTQRASSLTSAATSLGTARQATKEPAVAIRKRDSGYGKDIKDIPRSMWRLVCNPVYVVTCLGACMELIIVSGFVVFLPKYLETQFSLGKSQASVFTGSIAIPGACIGIFMGGCLLKRLELRPKGAVQFVLVSNSICLACYTLLFFLGCDNVKMAGTTIPYFNSSGKPLEPFQVNLTAACNFGCECRMTDVEPVCGNNGLTYFSPCHAGCTALSSRSNYTNCACIHGNFTNIMASASTAAGISGGEMGNHLNIGGSRVSTEEFAEVTVVPVATAGPCNSPCRTIFPFLILLFFMTFIVAITQMPLLMIVLRSVSEEERSFALGMQFVIFRLFGYIPAPILFGNLIDSTCILWKSTCGEKGGRCLLYDIEQFRFRYVGICAGIKLLALALFLVDWWLVRRRRHLEDAGVITVGELVGSIISLDKIFEEHVPSLPLRIESMDPCLPVAALASPQENMAEVSEGNESREDGTDAQALEADA